MSHAPDAVDDAANWNGSPAHAPSLNSAEPAPNPHAEDGALRSFFGFDNDDEEWLARLRNAQTQDQLGCIGDYQLLAEIGHGGQGSVYQALQPGTNRIIAIKRLSAGSFATTNMRARFDREVEAASALNHPNIVRVYGTEIIQGQTVLAMEWIEGQPIDRWAAAVWTGQSEASGARKTDSTTDGGTPLPHNPVRRILEVFANACDAVSHAHQRGVLHRDLKPSNILVDEQDQPHVLDFGLAKLAAPDDASLTRGSAFLGTPAYASPEQVGLGMQHVDVRSDIYSLGVILYHMLSGELPYAPKASLAELFDAIRNYQPDRPSLRRRGINREVDAIVLKALEKDPAHRYQSVDALGDDLRRCLNNETVLAHPPSAAYQARKFIARHRMVFGSAVTIIIVLLAALVAVSAALLQTYQAQEETRRAQVAANQVNAFLNQMLASADPSVVRGYDLSVIALLDEAVRKLDDGALAGEPDAEARVRTTVAQAYQSLGLYPPARTQFQTALKLRRQTHGENHIEVAHALLKLADVLRWDEEFDEALNHIDHAERIYIAQVGELHESTIRARLARAIVAVRSTVGHEPQLLCDLLAQAIRLKGNEVNELVVDIKSEIGFAGYCSGDVNETIRILHETIEAQKQLYGENDERISRPLINLGALYDSIGKRAEAETLLTRAVEMRRELFGEDHPAYASALFNLANVTRKLHGLQAAERMYREVLAVQERRLAPGHYHTARTRLRMAQILLWQRQWDESEALFLQAIEEFSPKKGLQAERANWCRHHLADLYINQGRFEQAEHVLLELSEKVQEYENATNRIVAIRNTAALFIRLYENWGKAEAAAHWRARIGPMESTGQEDID